jgi:hypothetical protein
MDARLVAVPLLFLLCLSLAGCAEQHAANATPSDNGTVARNYEPTGNGSATGNDVFSKLIRNIDANRFSDYKVEGKADIGASRNGLPMGNLSAVSWANVSDDSGHALFYATLSMPYANSTRPVTFTREYYMTQDVVFGVMSGNWSRCHLPPSFPAAFNSQTEIAVSSIEPASLQMVGDEDVDGVPCYVLEGPWNPQAEIDFAVNSGHYPTLNLSDVEPIYGNVTLWISKDRYALMRQERDASIMIGGDIRVDASETTTYYDQNVTNVIDLPGSISDQMKNAPG